MGAITVNGLPLSLHLAAERSSEIHAATKRDIRGHKWRRHSVTRNHRSIAKKASVGSAESDAAKKSFSVSQYLGKRLQEALAEVGVLRGALVVVEEGRKDILGVA